METDTKSGVSGRRYPLSALFRAYAAGKAAEEWRTEWGLVLLYRPLAMLLAPLALFLGVPASGVTILSLLVALCLPAAALTAGALPLALLAILVLIMDCLDGTIARASDTVSHAGHYLDFITDIIFRASFYASIGFLARAQDPAGLQTWALPLALLAALLAITARLCRVYAERLTGAAPYGRASSPGGRMTHWIFSAVSGLDSLLPLAVLALGLTDRLGWLIPWLVFYSTLDFLYTQAAILRRIA